MDSPSCYAHHTDPYSQFLRLEGWVFSWSPRCLCCFCVIREWFCVWSDLGARLQEEKERERKKKKRRFSLPSSVHWAPCLHPLAREMGCSGSFLLCARLHSCEILPTFKAKQGGEGNSQHQSFFKFLLSSLLHWLLFTCLNPQVAVFLHFFPRVWGCNQRS